MSSPQTDVGFAPFEPWPDCEVHIEHGEVAAAVAAQRGDIVVVVDVLSFSTTLSMAIERNAEVTVLSNAQIDQAGGRQAVGAFLQAHVVAKNRADTDAKFTLSPASLAKVQAGDRLVLTSLNGATMVAAAAGAKTLFVGSLRSATATAAAINQLLCAEAVRVTLVCAAEHWSSVVPDAVGSRFATEDWLGAGLIASALANHGRSLSVEAELAADIALRRQPRIAETLARTVGGRELIQRGFAEDVALAAEIDITDTTARQDHDGFFRGRPAEVPD